MCARFWGKPGGWNDPDQILVTGVRSNDIPTNPDLACYDGAAFGTNHGWYSTSRGELNSLSGPSCLLRCYNVMTSVDVSQVSPYGKLTHARETYNAICMYILKFYSTYY